MREKKGRNITPLNVCGCKDECEVDGWSCSSMFSNSSSSTLRLLIQSCSIYIVEQLEAVTEKKKRKWIWECEMICSYTNLTDSAERKKGKERIVEVMKKKKNTTA